MNLFNLFTKPTPKRKKWTHKLGEDISIYDWIYFILLVAVVLFGGYVESL